MMNHRNRWRWFLFTIVIVSLFLPTALMFAQASDSGATAIQQEATALIADLQKRGERLRELQSKVASSEGERKSIYRNELVRRWDGFASQLDALVRNLEKQEEKGLDNTAQREAARELTSAVAAGLSDAALARQDALTKLEDRRAAASGDDRSALTREIRRESAVYRNLLKSIVDNIERMKALGLDTTAEGEQVDQLLEDRAAVLDGRLRLAVIQRNEAKELLRGAVDENKAALQKELSNANEQVKATAEALRSVLDQMNRRGLKTSERQELLVKSTGELGTATLDTRIAAGLIQEWWNDGRSWLRDNGPQLILRIVVVVLILVAFWFLSRMTGRAIGMAVRSSRLDVSVLLQDFFVALGKRAVLLIGLLVALSQLGINLAPLLAGLGIAGFIVGFALQDTLSNFASGLMILMYHPYDVGDTVEVAGVLGVVSKMSRVSTTIKTFDNQKLIVPNSKIWGDVIRNLTAEDTRRVDLVFGISYDDDIEKAEKIFAEEVEKHELVLADPAPVIKVSNLGDSSVDFIVRPWTKTPDYWNVYWDLTRNIKLRLDSEGITIPFPQRDVHLHRESE